MIRSNKQGMGGHQGRGKMKVEGRDNILNGALRESLTEKMISE